MHSKRVWNTLNVSLAIITVLLLLNLLEVPIPSLGKVSYALDKEPIFCVAEWQDSFNEVTDIDRCCLEARKQAECKLDRMQLELGESDWSCHSGAGTVKYRLNNKAYHYCTLQEIW